MPDIVLEPVRTGRPRDTSRDTVILEAALDLVVEVGYERVSMDAIAARAHASKATIYRRWDSKASLVAAAMSCRRHPDMEFPDKGCLREDLIAAMTLMAEGIGSEDLGLMTGLFAGMRSDPELAEIMRSDMFEEKRVKVEIIFTRAKARAEQVKPHAAALLLEIAPALVINRLLMVGEPTDETFIRHVVDDILLPVLAGPLP